jgi:uncharacterized membrane protein
MNGGAACSAAMQTRLDTIGGASMSELIIIGYNDHDTARAVYKEVLRLEDDFIVDLTGIALVTVDLDGQRHVETPERRVGVSAAGGALWGTLLGVLFLVPGLGLLVGGLVGALVGKLAASGLTADYQRRVQTMLGPGSAGVVVMASKITEDKFAAAISKFGGHVLKTSLSERDERELAEELSGDQA